MTCPKCGALLIREGLDTFRCEYCGATFSERELEMSSGADTSEKSALLASAFDNLKVENFGVAAEFYEQITRQYPLEYRGWWGQLICKTRRFTVLDGGQAWLFSLRPDVEMVMKTAPASVQEELKHTWDDYTRRVLEVEANRQEARRREEQHKQEALLRQQEEKRARTTRMYIVDAVMDAALILFVCVGFDKLMENPLRGIVMLLLLPLVNALLMGVLDVASDTDAGVFGIVVNWIGLGALCVYLLIESNKIMGGFLMTFSGFFLIAGAVIVGLISVVIRLACIVHLRRFRSRHE